MTCWCNHILYVDLYLQVHTAVTVTPQLDWYHIAEVNRKQAYNNNNNGVFFKKCQDFQYFTISLMVIVNLMEVV